MSDVQCPYCQYEQEICHDDGYGYKEGEKHEQNCPSCHKDFSFTTTMSFHYETECQGGHEMEEPCEESGIINCTRCDYYEVVRAQP